MMSALDPYLGRAQIAYFTMEIALEPDMHTYSGGLGILAGDTARSAADLELPMVFVSLVSRAGYMRQEIDPHGRQVDHPDPWNPAERCTSLNAMVAVEIEGRPVWIRPWLYIVSCPLGHRVPVVLLDADVDDNAPDDRRITDTLYGGDAAYRLKQEILLGIGGERMLRALGFQITTYHLNEGHAALLTLALLRRTRREAGPWPDPLLYDVDAVREQCVFTTHTPVEAGHDRFDYSLVQRLLGSYIEIDQLKLLTGEDWLNMTHLALTLAGYINGVARRHAETAARLYPGYHVRAITNGVHVPGWTHPSFARLYETIAPNWGHEPELLIRADQLDSDLVWQARSEAKADLVAKVRELSGTVLDPALPIVGFARRITGYKRPELLFSDLDRLSAIARQQPFQIVLAGKAHPRDDGGKVSIERLHDYIRRLAGVIPVAFLPNYDPVVARSLVPGSDIWLQHTDASAGGLWHVWHEGRAQRRAESERTGWLVD